MRCCLFAVLGDLETHKLCSAPTRPLPVLSRCALTPVAETVKGAVPSEILRRAVTPETDRNRHAQSPDGEKRLATKGKRPFVMSSLVRSEGADTHGPQG